MKTVFKLFLILMLSTSFFFGSLIPPVTHAQSIDVFVGIDVAHGNFEELKALVDEICTYTNLFVVGCTAITHNQTLLDDTCQYLFDKGMSFIVYQEWPLGYSRRSPTVSDWIETAKSRWGQNFLGLHYLDESGGRQLDQSQGWIVVDNAENYSDASNKFNLEISGSVNWFRRGYSGGTDVSLFMSDYALYWYDYKAGYDGLFAELGWNYSRQLNIALCRGGASIQNKEWGVIITWTYTEPPYIESGLELYSDLVLAYENGAKYIIVFDTNKDYTQGILEREHLDALKQFWQYIQNNPRSNNPSIERTAYVLPEDYAYGFRGPEDKIWGLWEADNIAYEMSLYVNHLLEIYGYGLDIIYDDNLTSNNTAQYKQLIYWNATNSNLNPTPTPTQAPSPTPTEYPILTPTTTPTQSPKPSISYPATFSPTPIEKSDSNGQYFTTFLVAASIILVASTLILLKKQW
jgi:hypothetical protein